MHRRTRTTAKTDATKLSAHNESTRFDLEELDEQNRCCRRLWRHVWRNSIEIHAWYIHGQHFCSRLGSERYALALRHGKAKCQYSVLQIATAVGLQILPVGLLRAHVPSPPFPFIRQLPALAPPLPQPHRCIGEHHRHSCRRRAGQGAGPRACPALPVWEEEGAYPCRPL